MATLLNETVYEFESDQRAGRCPRIENYLPAGSDRLAVLIELTHIDLEYRLKRGDSVRLETWLERFPELRDHRAELLELVQAEWDLRCRQESASRDEYTARFPELADELESRLQASASGSGVVLRCPHCSAALSVLDAEQLSDVRCSSCGNQIRLAAEALAPGDRIGPFLLIEQVGVGGFGSVWRARDPHLDRDVAVKVPRYQPGETEAEAFFREARATAGLRHPNIVTTYEVGRDGKHIYIASDFIKGHTLAETLEQRRFSPREAAALCLTICGALECAHAAGVIHRDLKPGNIMIDTRGAPIVMDFGLARRSAGEVTMTIDGRILGTPAYMSPEQAAGAAHSADQRSDIYSLGVVLFQLLTHEVPFRGGVQMVLHQVLDCDAPAPRSLEPSVPRDLETICLRCLEKRPDRRYASAHELAMELRRFLEGTPIESRPISRFERVSRWCVRKPVTAMLMSLLAVVAVAAPIVAINQAELRWAAEDSESRLQTALAELRAENARTTAAHAEKAVANLQLQRSLTEAKDLTNRAELLAYAASLSVARSRLESGEPATAGSILAKTPPHRRGWEYGYLQALTNRFCKQIPLPGAADALFVREGTVLLENHRNRVLARDLSGVAMREFEVEQLSRPHTIAIAWCSRLNRVLALDRIGLLTQWDLDSGNLICWHHIPDISVDKSDRQRHHGLAVHPTRPIVAVASGSSGTIYQVHMDTGEFVERPQGGHFTRRDADYAERLMYSPQGKLLIALGSRGMTVHRNTGSYSDLAGGLGGRCCPPVAYNPADGEFFYRWNLARLDEDARSLMPQVTRTLTASGPAITPEQLRTMRSQTLPSSGELIAVAFKPDGTRFATGIREGPVQLWDSADGRLLHRLNQLDGLQTLAWTADDKLCIRGPKALAVWDLNALSDPTALRPGTSKPAAPSVRHGHLIAERTQPVPRQFGTYAAIRIRTDAADGAKATLMSTPQAGPAGPMAFLQKGTLLLAGDRLGTHFAAPGRITVFEVSSGKVLQTCEIGPGYYAGQTFAPIPGTTRFVVPDGPQLQILDALSGQPVRSLPVPRPRPGDDRDLPRVAQIHASADGSMLHLRLASEGIVALDLAAEKTLGQIASTDTWDMSPAADGRIAVAFRDRVDIFSPDLQTRLATLTGFRRRPLSCMFSPDGTRLLAIGESGILRVFESHTGIELLAEPIVAYRPSNRIQIQRFDADGRTLLMSGISDDFQLVDFRLEGSPAETTHAP